MNRNHRIPAGRMEATWTADDVEVVSKDSLIYVGGSKEAYRCDCGSNVFTTVLQKGKKKYICHGCGQEYEEG